MKLTRLERASDIDVRKWLAEKLDLTPYQKEKLRDNEFIRFSPFHFYTKPAAEEKPSFLWRLTIIVFPFYLLGVICSNPIKWLFTGKWGMSMKFYDNFHAKWCRKIGIHI